MKNVYVLPHSEIGFDPKKSTNIYITTNEKPKLNDWVLDILDNVMFRVTEEDILTTELDGLPFNFKKIILTTDEELIKEGVQAIDDEFLEWFVENPSCESVIVNKTNKIGWCSIDLLDKKHDLSKGIYNAIMQDANKFEYKILLPKEEPKPYTQDDYFNDEFPQEEPKQECKDCNTSLEDCTCIEDTIDMKQETIEEVAEIFVSNRFAKQISGDKTYPDIYASKEAIVESHILFAKWQQERSYSEEVICKHCKKPISVKDINNHLFMTIKGGGLIHWNCKTI